MVNIKEQLVEQMTKYQQNIDQTVNKIAYFQSHFENKEPRSITVFETMDTMKEELFYMLSEKKKLEQKYNKLYNAIIDKIDEYERLLVQSHSPVRKSKSNTKTKKKYNSI